MGLVGKSELLSLNDIVDVLILANCVLWARAVLTRLRSLGENLGGETWMVSEKLGSVDARDGVDRNVGCLVLESTMHIHARINAPNSGTEALNRTEFVPLRRLSVVDFEGYILTNLVGSTANDHHKRSEEQCGVLVARCGCLTGLVWGLDPVPATIAMSSETPSVAQARLVSGASTEADHHACSTAGLTESRRVVDAGRWLLTTTVQLVPTEGRSLYTEAPYIVDWLCASVTSIDEKVWL